MAGPTAQQCRGFAAPAPGPGRKWRRTGRPHRGARPDPYRVQQTEFSYALPEGGFVAVPGIGEHNARCNAGCYSLSELGQRNLWRIDSIPHLPLLAKVAGRIADGRVLEGSATQDAIRWTRGKKTSLNARCLPFPIQAGVTCAVASAIASMQFVAQGTFVSHWLGAYFFSWVAMLPVVIVAAPFIRWLANRITR